MSKYEEKYREYVALCEKTLTKKRFNHSLNVAREAVMLAERFGADEERAFVAGILHDIKKEETPAAAKSLAILSGMDLCEYEIMTPALWHGPAAAYYIRKNLGISDSDILNAVRYHTAGRDNMSALEKIVYLADMTSADRDYKDVDKFRKAARDDLDYAMYIALKSSITDTISKGGYIPLCTMKGYNFYNAVYKKNGGKGKDND